MPRTFLSFLGAIPYLPTCYYLAGDRQRQAAPTHYLQEAIFSLALTDWGSDDRAVIFTTAEALEANYHHRIARHGEPPVAGDGLESRLLRLQEDGRLTHFEQATIPNGYSEAEIWEVFQIVFDYLHEGDEVYIDVTFGFRSLPMLAIVLLDYAKALKNITVKAIYYGNYEVGRAERDRQLAEWAGAGRTLEEIAALKASPPASPILNLLPFSALQDWTRAARFFLEGGNANALAQLAGPTHPHLAAQLTAFTDAILTCRGSRLMQTLDIDGLKQLAALQTDAQTPQAQLQPLLAKVTAKLAPFHSRVVTNGLAAVQWCIDHGLVQQGFTFLQESLVSWLVEQCFDAAAITDYRLRECAATAFNVIPRVAWSKKHPPEEFAILENMTQHLASYPGLTNLYKRMTGKAGLRNDINHCGFSAGAQSPGVLRSELEALFHQIKALQG